MTTHQITANNKPVVDTVKVSTAISRSEVCELLIRRFGQWRWERLVKLAANDQERSLAFLDVGLRCDNAQQVREDVYG
jgi:hypothetical protein